MPIIKSSAWSWEEAFDKFGFGDGDGPVMTDIVALVLETAGYTVAYETWGSHNVVIHSIKTAAGDEQIPRDGISFGYDDPRDYLPDAIITLLDTNPRTGNEVRS
jgi:hypothetical protein